MKQKIFFLFFCTVFVVGKIFSQKINATVPTLLFTPFAKKPATSLFLYSPDNFSKPVINTFLPADFYTTQIGFFCKQEIKLERLTKIPFRFRLGSVEACDRLEGKMIR